jgi:hypothetical protein
VAGDNAIMPIIIRGKGKRYSWKIGQAPLADMANTEKMLPRHYISGNGFEVTPAGKAYLAPLILGEDYPPYKNGLPDYVKLKKQQVTKKLKPMKM